MAMKNTTIIIIMIRMTIIIIIMNKQTNKQIESIKNSMTFFVCVRVANRTMIPIIINYESIYIIYSICVTFSLHLKNEKQNEGVFSSSFVLNLAFPDNPIMNNQMHNY